MADESVLSPISAAEPPKVNPLKPVAPAGTSTLKLAPAIKRPVTGATQSALRPTLKLPPKPGTVATAGLKLPPKPGTVATAGLKLPPKPVIRKPGTAPAASTLPPPVKSASPAAPAEKPAESAAAAPQPAAPQETASAAPVKNEAAQPVTVDAGGVVKLPTVELKAVDRTDVKPPEAEAKAPLDALKQVTQKLKGTTQQIPQQAILRKTGIIADASMSEAQKQAAKSKTARISLSEAIGAAPVKNENAPMKTIRIKRPVGIPTAVKSEEPAAAGENPAAETPAAENTVAENPTASVTQRKTLKISRPGTGAVRPGGKFGVKRPSQAVTKPAEANAEAEGEAAVPEIADIPDMPSVAAIPDVSDISAVAQEGPAWLISLSTLVQAAASIAIGALAWFLFENTQTVYF